MIFTETVRKNYFLILQNFSKAWLYQNMVFHSFVSQALRTLHQIFMANFDPDNYLTLITPTQSSFTSFKLSIN